MLLIAVKILFILGIWATIAGVQMKKWTITRWLHLAIGGGVILETLDYLIKVGG